MKQLTTMKLATLLMLLTSWLALSAPAADEPQWPNPMSTNSEYLADVRLVRGELTIFADDRRWRDVIVQVLATQYSFIGRHQKALESFDEILGRSVSAPRSDMLAGLEACDAVQTILDLAEQRQVVMVNEAHHVPMHRAFTIQLLEALYREGFRYFAVETLSEGDTGLQSRGYPTRKSGFYISEPVCADMLRIALRLGYQVVSYEFEEETPPQSGDDPRAGQRAREEGQAKNLKERILAKDPKARILVHAGYSHISKKVVKGRLGEFRFMAWLSRK